MTLKVKRELFATIVLTLLSTLAASLAVFAVIDAFPQRIALSPRNFPYLAVRREYTVDPDLVFKRRAGHRDLLFPGDSYHESYAQAGVRPTPIRFEETINEQGFRDEAAVAHPDVLVIGDSFVEIGESPEDTFASRFTKDSGRTTANFGAAWSGPLQYYEILRKYGVERGGKVALICIFEGNDLEETRAYLHWKKGENYFQFRFHPSTGFFGRFGLALDDLMGLFVRRTMLTADGSSSSDELVEIGLGDKRIKASFRYLPDSRSSRSIREDEDGRGMALAFRKIRELASSNGIRPVLVFIPTAAHVYAPYTTDRSSRSWIKALAKHRANLPNVERVVAELAASEKLPLIDLTPTFEAAAKAGRLLYYPFDTHWNSEGRELAAKEVALRLGRETRPQTKRDFGPRTGRDQVAAD